MFYCRLCSAKCAFDYESNISESTQKQKQQQTKYQCNKCFYIGEPIMVYNFDDNCPICLEKKKFKYVYDICHHYTCKTCYDYSKFDKKCPLCLSSSKVCQLPSSNLTFPGELKYFNYNTTYCFSTNYNYFQSLDLTIQECFKKLYKQIDDMLGKNLQVDKYHNIIYLLCVEYHKFLILLIVNNNNNNINKLASSIYIHAVWTKHILDNKNYTLVCNQMCNYVLNYYSMSYAKMIYADCFDNTIKLYKQTFGEIDSTTFDIWNPLLIYYDNRDDHIYNLTIFIYTDPYFNHKNNKKIICINTTSDKTIDDIKTILKNDYKYDINGCRFHIPSKLHDLEKGTLCDNKVGTQSNIYILRRY